MIARFISVINLILASSMTALNVWPGWGGPEFGIQ